ncbi:PE family protein [Mycobacterium riyadhense]|uniref:PE domain-containing protein n=1 Tax=Mycobacterium riyadhense TaxID=486698 RepID=A0A1X2D9B3_9MYCO|nr:PE family protein [Mycobacterium riyadhense]MCV7147678.1 PE family protein [Mycobacterium riyadhense]ORW84765.1 hypothetical protein AWC22_12750 [Mycobacterium riyadhense]VTO95224.1 PE family protein [Mycobacterium riyadhense]
MSLVVVAPETVQAAVRDLLDIGSGLQAANTAATAITGVGAPGLDEVSEAVTSLINAFGQTYREISVQAAAFYAQFVQLLHIAAEWYWATDAINDVVLAQGIDDQIDTSPPGG